VQCLKWREFASLGAPFCCRTWMANFCGTTRKTPRYSERLKKVVAALTASGFDPFVGRKLFWLAQNAGLTNIEVQAECYHLIAGEAEPHILKQWELKLEIAKPQLARVLGGETEAEEQSRAFLEYLRRPDTLTYSTIFTVAGEKSL